MKTVKRSALVLHGADKMFALVNDVQRYAEFLPWCGESEELSRTDAEVVAKLTIDYGGITQSFTTCNQLVGAEKTRMNLVEGPFSHLSGSWEFVSLDAHSSKVILELEFDFSNPAVGRLVGPVFRRIANSMVDAFCRRADQVYAADLDRLKQGTH